MTEYKTPPLPVLPRKPSPARPRPPKRRASDAIDDLAREPGVGPVRRKPR